MTNDETSSDSVEVGRPDSWIFLTGDPATVPIPRSSLDATRSGGNRRGLGLVVAITGVVVLYIWDDLILAAPAIAVAGWIGPWPAFAIFSAVYGSGSFFIAMFAVRRYEQYTDGTKSALARFIEAQTTGRRGSFARRMIESGKFIGFVISSIALGAIATTWLIRYSGRTEGIRKIAALSSAIFGVGFVAPYVGVAALIF